MHFLIITQVFWPDTASTAQHLGDLAEELGVKGHQVTVFTSRFNYEDPAVMYPAFEKLKNIRICRIRNTGFGKGNILGRLLDILSFNLLLFLKLLWISVKEYDGIIGMTSPPLISFLGCLVAGMKKIPFVYWTMDLQPELAIASGLMKRNSLAARVFSGMGNYIFKRADVNITLDEFMKAHVIGRGAAARKVSVVPVWPVLESVYEGGRLDNPFRLENGFGERIVVMYSGNHSYVHPLDTLLDAALELRDNDRFLFVFVGEGVRKKDVSAFKEAHRLGNIAQLPYQPRSRIHVSLAAADLHVVIMGDGQVGYTHPNKVYGAMFAGKPVLYIGPEPSHVTFLLRACPGNISVRHHAVAELVARLEQFAAAGTEAMEDAGGSNREYALKHFNPGLLREKMAQAVIGACSGRAADGLKDARVLS